VGGFVCEGERGSARVWGWLAVVVEILLVSTDLRLVMSDMEEICR
jgi:hypothetical protein